jgi:prepilin-type N-terminal cleavage/methylation domain-containing protein
MQTTCTFNQRAALRGFTLIEFAIGMFLMSVLLSAILTPLTAQIEQRKVNETQSTLAQISDALMGFATAHGYLPCPDRMTGPGANDGIEDLNAGGTNCAVAEGNLPWVSLGLGGTDAWGNLFRYRATSAFTDRANPFRLTTAGTLNVQCPAGSCGVATTYTNTAPAVVLSHGANGYGAVNAQTRSANIAPTSNDELANTDGNASYISRSIAAPGSAAGEFDDLVVWLSTSILLNKMIVAQRLP